MTGEFQPSDYPTELELMLKEQAQVMFVRNDRNGRWVNGTIGRVVKAKNGKVEVETENGSLHTVEEETWEKHAYGYDEETRQIVSTIVGTFTQVPLRLAWALTVHKSQGLSFDAVEINAPTGFFDAGQLYVALSRCRSFSGLRLQTPIRAQDIMVSPEVAALYSRANDKHAVALAIQEALPSKLYRQSAELWAAGNIPAAISSLCRALALRNEASNPAFERLLRRKLASWRLGQADGATKQNPEVISVNQAQTHESMLNYADQLHERVKDYLCRINEQEAELVALRLALAIAEQKLKSERKTFENPNSATEGLYIVFISESRKFLILSEQQARSPKAKVGQMLLDNPLPASVKLKDKVAGFKLSEKVMGKTPKGINVFEVVIDWPDNNI